MFVGEKLTKMFGVAVPRSARTFIIWFTEDLTFVAAILLVYLLREIYICQRVHIYIIRILLSIRPCIWVYF